MACRIPLRPRPNSPIKCKGRARTRSPSRSHHRLRNSRWGQFLVLVNLFSAMSYLAFCVASGSAGLWPGPARSALSFIPDFQAFPTSAGGRQPRRWEFHRRASMCGPHVRRGQRQAEWLRSRSAASFTVGLPKAFSEEDRPASNQRLSPVLPGHHQEWRNPTGHSP